jgi:3-deoxy-D-manno-octulosonic-acid transferase
MSVGEVISTTPVIRQLKTSMPDATVILTVSTLSGYQTARQMHVNDVDEISFYPYDHYFSVRSIVARIRPDMFILVESDCWPNILNVMRKRKIPLMFVNARLSDRSFSSFMKMKNFVSLMFRPFTRICAQCEEDARRFQALGVDRDIIRVTGNIKFDQNIEKITENDIRDMRRLVGAGEFHKIWIAGSTHAGEEQIIAQSLGKISKTVRDLILVIAPRDPNRSSDVVNIFRKSGFKTCSLAEIESGNGGSNTEVVVIDRIGLLRRLYAVGDIALVGGSLTKIKGIGGHNPLEPAVYSKPVIFGENMKNFRDIAGKFISAKGSVEVADSDDLSDTMHALLSNPEKASAIGKRAYWVFANNKGALKNTLKTIKEFMETEPRQKVVVKLPPQPEPMQPQRSFQPENDIRMANHRR